MSGSITKSIQNFISYAMSSGDWSFVEAMRTELLADDPLSKALLKRLEIEVLIAKATRGVANLMPLLEGRDELVSDVDAMLELAKQRIELASCESRTALLAREGLRKRWASASNAALYADAIRKAKDMMAVGNDREQIIAIVKHEKCVKGLTSGKLVRILRDNRALPSARKRRSDG